MTAALPLVLRTLMVALVLVTALGLGVARGQAPVVGHVEFCGHAGVTLVAVDAQGQPVKAPGHCPDCAALLLVPLPGGADAEGPAPGPARMLGMGAGADLLRAGTPACPGPPARGPPAGAAA